VLGGLCPLVPIPFLDDWLLGRVKRWMIADLGRGLTMDLDREARAILAGGRDAWRLSGCGAGCVWAIQKVFFGLLIKLFRKVLYFLAIRDGLHAATEVFHEGYLASYALERADMPAQAGPQRNLARHVRIAVLKTLDTMDLQPVRDVLRRTFRGSWGVLIAASRALAGPFLRRKQRRAAEAGDSETEAQVRASEEERLGGLVDRAAAALWGNREYFEGLEATFVRHLEGIDSDR